MVENDAIDLLIFFALHQKSLSEDQLKELNAAKTWLLENTDGNRTAATSLAIIAVV